MRIIYDPAASTELEDAARYIDARRPGWGRIFLESVIAVVDRAHDHPASGVAVHRSRRRGAVRRVLVPRFPYALYYVSGAPDEITVVAVAHAHRRPKYWRKRL